MTLRSAGKNFLYGQFHEKLTRNLFDICLRLLPVFSINRGEEGWEGVSKISLRNRGRGILLTLSTVTKRGGRAKVSPKTVLRNV